MLEKFTLAIVIIAVATFLYSLFHDSAQLTEASSVISGIALTVALVTSDRRKKSNRS